MATVLFSDLTGYTAMSERLDPEDVEGIMRRIKTRAVEIVETHGGIVNQFVGDEVLALFGIPDTKEDDPARAVRAAMDLHAMVRELSDESAATLGVELRMHSGINTGLVLAQALDDRDGRYGITGDTVNTGARLASSAAPDEILLSPETQRLVGPYFKTEALPALTMKGKALPVAPYRLDGVTEVRTRFEASQQRGLTQFCGRDREMALLGGYLNDAIDGRGIAVTLIGEAGQGKSRLVHEFRKSLDDSEVEILEGRCQPYGGGTPYLPFLDAMRQALGISATTDTATAHDLAVRGLLGIDANLEPQLPQLLHVLSIPSGRYPLPEELQGAELAEAIESALTSVARNHSRHKPLVIVFEDWHWADHESESALMRILDEIGDKNMLVLLPMRPGYPRAAPESPRAVEIQLQPLDFDQTNHVVSAVFGSDNVPPGLTALIYGRTGGNPLFSEELAISILEESAVVVESAQARLTRPLEQIEIPGSVHGVIRARVDRLSWDARAALRMASIVGLDVDISILEQVYTSATALTEVLEDLCDARLLQPGGEEGGSGYRFNNSLTQSVVYETQLLQVRRRHHGMVASVMESLFADRLEENYEALAHQFRNSDTPERAVDYLTLSADKAIQSYSLSIARGHYQDALQLLQSLPSNAARCRQRVELSLKWAYLLAGNPSREIIDILDVSKNLAMDLKDRALWIRVTCAQGYMNFLLAEVKSSREQLEQVLLLSAGETDPESIGLAYSYLGRIYYMQGQTGKSAEFLSKAIPFLEHAGNSHEVGMSNGMLGFVLCWQGEFARSEQYLEAALKIGESTRSPSLMEWSNLWTGTGFMVQGRLSEATEYIVKGCELAERLGDDWTRGIASFFAGYVSFLAGELQEALKNISDGVRLMEDSETKLELAAAYAGYSEALAGQGNRAEALRYAELACASAEEWGRERATSYRAHAIALAMQDEPDWSDVDRLLQISREAARDAGGRPDLAQSYLSHGKIMIGREEFIEAKRLLAEAEQLFTDMDMPLWVERTGKLQQRLPA